MRYLLALSTLFYLSPIQHSFAQSQDNASAQPDQLRLTTEASNRKNYELRKNELDSLLAAPRKFPVVYDISPKTGEQKIIVMMLKSHYRKLWKINEIFEKDESGTMIKRIWEIYPKTD